MEQVFSFPSSPPLIHTWVTQMDRKSCHKKRGGAEGHYRGRDWNDEVCNRQELEEARNRISPRASRGSVLRPPDFCPGMLLGDLWPPEM